MTFIRPNHSEKTCTDVYVEVEYFKSDVTAHYSSVFLGFCLDCSASPSVIGVEQERCYGELTTLSSKWTNSRTVYRFGTSLTRIKGLTRMGFPLPGGVVIGFHTDVVDRDIPLFLGLDDM